MKPAQTAGPGRIAAAGLAGLAHALSIAWPLHVLLPQGEPVAWLQVLALTALVAQLDRCRSVGQAALTGLCFATAMLGGTFWWLFISMHTYGGLAAPLAALAVLALASALGLYYAGAAALYLRWRPDSIAGRVLGWAGLWLTAELARVVLFTGFPWGQSGYAHVNGWAQTLAPWVGVHGLSWLSAAVAAGLALWLLPERGPRKLVPGLGLAAAAVLLAWLPHQPQTQTPRPPLSVSLVQGNIPQDEKFVAGTGVALALEYYGEKLQQADGSLLILPETAIPLLPQQLPADYWQQSTASLARGTGAALIGMPLGSVGEGYTNSVIGLQAGQSTPYRYDKHHLVPFGEFIPPLFRWFVQLMNIPLGDFERGALGQASFEWQGERLAPNICYEDLFGEELGARFADPALAPTVFVNLSNIAWFGPTVAIDQHLQISRMRALEFGRPMVRATNTGATAVIDAQGRVLAMLPPHTRGVLRAQVQGAEGLTVYARAVAAWGLGPAYVLALLSLLAAGALRGVSRRARTNTTGPS